MAAVYDFDVDQGSTKRFYLIWSQNTGTDDLPVWTPYPLAGCTAKMQIRQGHEKPVIVEISTSTTDGSVTLEDGGETGRIDVWLSDENTQLIELKTTHYDLKVTFPSGDGVRVLQGKIACSLSITQ